MAGPQTGHFFCLILPKAEGSAHVPGFLFCGKARLRAGVASADKKVSGVGKAHCGRDASGNHFGLVVAAFETAQGVQGDGGHCINTAESSASGKVPAEYETEPVAQQAAASIFYAVHNVVVRGAVVEEKEASGGLHGRFLTEFFECGILVPVPEISEGDVGETLRADVLLVDVQTSFAYAAPAGPEEVPKSLQRISQKGFHSSGKLAPKGQICKNEASIVSKRPLKFTFF